MFDLNSHQQEIDLPYNHIFQVIPAIFSKKKKQGKMQTGYQWMTNLNFKVNSHPLVVFDLLGLVVLKLNV